MVRNTVKQEGYLVLISFNSSYVSDSAVNLLPWSGHVPLTFSCLKLTVNSQSRAKKVWPRPGCNPKELPSPLHLLQITVERTNHQNRPSSCDFESLTNCHGCPRDCKPGRKPRQLTEPWVPYLHQWQSRSYCFWGQIDCAWQFLRKSLMVSCLFLIHSSWLQWAMKYYKKGGFKKWDLKYVWQLFQSVSEVSLLKFSLEYFCLPSYCESNTKENLTI